MVVRHDAAFRDFVSDNYAGVHPRVLAAIERANGGHQPSYGADVYTAALGETMREHFGGQCEVYCVFNGTGANVVGLQAMTTKWSAVVCAASAHVNVDEGGAPERVAGLKLLALPAPGGKLAPAMVTAALTGVGDEHRAQPAVLAISQATEMGTCYSIEELSELCQVAHGSGLRVHMDGARLANAAAFLGVPLRALTTDCGVDVLSFGGTKNGAMLGEAVVVLNPGAVEGIGYLRKAGMQLGSKMRFLAVQLEALLDDGLWLENARRANEMARLLEAKARAVPGVRVTQPVQANSVFAILPEAAVQRLRERYAFYTWDEATGEVRWMTSFDTTEEDVEAFATCLTEAMSA
jgi:threonine aldolase